LDKTGHKSLLESPRETMFGQGCEARRKYLSAVVFR
jgi:hypothetical protein